MERLKNDLFDDFILNWDRFIIDKWWRDKYSISFGSIEHRKANWIDMAIEYRESVIFNRLSSESKTLRNEDEDGEGFTSDNDRVVSMTQEEIDEDYNNLDLSKFEK